MSADFCIDKSLCKFLCQSMDFLLDISSTNIGEGREDRTLHFFFETQNEPITSRQNYAHTVNYGSRPACVKSRSTSWEARHAPSAPRAPGNSKRDDATALATVQEKSEPHLRRQACSTLLRSKGGTDRALARARELKNLCVSWDHRPQTSTASTTKRARPRRPTNSGYLRSLRCRVAAKATPSTCTRRGTPLAWSVLTMVVSTASWAPPKRGNPSATTSNRRASAAFGSARSSLAQGR